MTKISDVYKAKQVLETGIWKLVHDFENEADGFVAVTNISMDRVQAIGQRGEISRVYVEARVCDG